MTTTTTKKQTPLKLFLFTPEGESGIKTHEITAYVISDPKIAEAVTRAFYSGPINTVFPLLDGTTKHKILSLGIDPADAVSGEVGVHEDTLKRYAPDLLV